MTPEEFERLKEEEKAHLRKLKALKQQHRDAQRKKGILDALSGIVRPDLDEVHDEMVDKLTMKNIESEARFEVAMENANLTEDALEKAAQEEADREATRKAEAEELVRQMKLEAGETPDSPSESTQSTASGKSIGRIVPDEPESETEADNSTPERGPKTIGRG